MGRRKDRVPDGLGAGVTGLFKRFVRGLRKADRPARSPGAPRRGGTSPSKRPDAGAAPRGGRTHAHPTKKKDRPLRRENESADVMARDGYDVEQNPPPRPNGKEPDYRIEGEYFDCYAPTSDNLDNVRDQLSSKVRDKNGNLQADRIVLNLDDSPLSTDQIRDVLTRKPIADLKEIFVVKDGKSIPFFPFE